MNLRPHQELAKNMLRESFAKGNKRIILGAPCSFGKTITSVSIALDAVAKGRRVMFVCDRVKLIKQSIEAFDRAGIEIGVIQSHNERYNPRAMIQIASIQTLARRMKIRMPEFEFCIIDECHTHYKAIQYMMDRYSNVPFIGLSGTPFSKGLGKAYQDLVVPITSEELMAQGYLTPVDYYAGSSVDVKGIKKRALSTGGTDFDPKSLGKAIEDDKVMTGDIIKNWRKHANGMMTIAFSPSIKHSKYLVEMFNNDGISAVHIDGYMEDEDREFIYRAHEKGEFLILSCSMLLSVGYDSPKVQAMIDCYPTSSKILWIQRWGRILRLAEGKTKAIYLDHAGNIQRHGMFPEEVVPESLDDGEAKYNEKSLLKKEKKESTPKECPKCSSIMKGLRCVCGYEYPIQEAIETTPEMLEKIDKYTMDQKMDFYSGMLKIALNKGYSKGWAYYAYKEKFGVFPNKKPEPSLIPCDEAVRFAKYKQIRYSKSRK
jgi:DNA repair protein RadD